jgi:hypothetical protein
MFGRLFDNSWMAPPEKPIPLLLAPGEGVFRFSWKWRMRCPIKIMERTHEEATEALYAGRESRYFEAASVGAGSNLRNM